MRLRIIVIILVSMLMLPLIPFIFEESEGAATLYVGSGSTYKTIQDAVDAASPGDTIRVAKGTYNESVHITTDDLNVVGNSSKDCRVEAYFLGSTYVIASSCFNITSSGVNVTGFNLTARGGYTFGVNIRSTGAVNNKVFSNNITVISSAGVGVLISQNSENNVVSNNSIKVTGPGGAHGILFITNADKNEAINNTIFISPNNGIGIFSNNVDENIIRDNSITTYGSNGYGIRLTSSEHCDLINNTIVTGDTGAYGIRVDTNSHYNYISNNDITTSGWSAYGISFWSNVGSSCEHNDLFNNTVRTFKDNSYGIYLFQNSKNNDIINNTINTTGSSGAGIVLISASDYNNIMDNRLNISQSIGIQLNNVDNINITNNIIVTGLSGNNNDGIRIESTSNDNIRDNRILIKGFQGNGIRFQTSCTNINVTNNTIMTKDQLGHGIQIRGSTNNNISDNRINLTDSTSYGIYLWPNILIPTKYNDIINNTIMSTAQSARGIVASTSSHNNIIDNKINTTKTSGYGIYIVSKANYNNVTNNIINTSQTLGYGIYLYDEANYNNVSDNIIVTHLNPSHGIFIQKTSNSNLVHNNTILSRGSDAHGIYITGNCFYNNVTENRIRTISSNADGIRIDSASEYNNLIANKVRVDKRYGIVIESAVNNKIMNNTVNTTQVNAYGIYLFNSAGNNNVSNNKINTTGNAAYCIIIESSSSNNDIINNTAFVEGPGSAGIYIFDKSSINDLIDNKIYPRKSTCRGIYIDNQAESNDIINNSILTSGTTGASAIEITSLSHFNTIKNTTIITRGNNEYGVEIDASNNTYAYNCTITTYGSTAPGFYLDGEYATVEDCNITTGAGSNDLVSINDGNLTVIDINTSKVVSYSGVVQMFNYLSIQAYYEDGSTPIPGADVEIRDNGVVVYASSGYSGSYPATDSSGRVENILISDRWYVYSNTATENNTAVKVKKTIDATWEGTKPDVNMTESHTEIFISTDIQAPAAPTGVTIERQGTANSLNISWNLNTEPDMFNYTVYVFKNNKWITLADIIHPQNFTFDPDLPDETLYKYKISAWDSSGLSSANSSEKQFYLTDITPPAMPGNLKARSVVATNDAFNISWDKNIDDTIKYSVWWENPQTLLWEEIANITHPQNWTVFEHNLLVHKLNYRFKIKAFDKVALASPFSSPIEVMHYDYKAPDTPAGLTATTLSESKINLIWGPSIDTDVTFYRISINHTGYGSGGPYVPLMEINALSYKVTGLKPSTTYYFVVVAIDEANLISSNSNEASNTTMAAAPGKPSIDDLRDYTNKPKLNVTGSADAGVTVLVYIGTSNVASGIADGSGSFKIGITLSDGSNEIKVQARNAAMVTGPFSDTQTVILDREAPKAEAGADKSILKGESVTFNASASTDNYDIVNFTWSFEYGSRAVVELYGEETGFKFDEIGDYEVTLTVTDLADNTGADTLMIKVTEAVQRPKVVSTDPEEDEKNVTVDTTVTITFDMAMNISSFDKKIEIIPEVDFNTSWSSGNKVLRLNFESDLKYNTTYTVTIGMVTSEDGGTLEGAPFSLSFTTEEEIVTPPKATVTISPISDTDIEPGETITVSGTSTEIDRGTEVTVEIDGQTATGTVEEGGSWSVSIKAPDTPGSYAITVTIGDTNQTDTITVLEPEEKKDEDEAAGFNMLYAVLAIIVMIIVLLILFFLMKRRKPEEEEREELEEEEAEEEGEEAEFDEEEIEEGTFEEEEVEFEEEGEEEFEEEDLGGEEEFEEEAEEEEGLEEGLDELDSMPCPKCGSVIEVPFSEDAKVSMECPECGAKGKIKNPYI